MYLYVYNIVESLIRAGVSVVRVGRAEKVLYMYVYSMYMYVCVCVCVSMNVCICMYCFLRGLN